MAGKAAPRRRLRSAGSRWRILVHHRTPGERVSDRSYDITSDPRAPEHHEATLRHLDAMRPDLPPSDRSLTRITVLEDTEFDELVIGRWIHLEQMDTGKWWMNVAGITIDIAVDRDGRPVFALVQGPGEFADAVPGCEYEIAWARKDDAAK